MHIRVKLNLQMYSVQQISEEFQLHRLTFERRTDEIFFDLSGAPKLFS